MTQIAQPAIRPRSRGTGFVQSMAMSAARGGILIGVAIVLGLVLLQVIDNAGGGGGGEGAGGVAVTTAPTTETTAPTTETSAPVTTETRPPNQIRVLVLNGADPAAPLGRDMSNQLRSRGYQTVPPNNTDPRTGTIVTCQEAFAADADALAAAVGPTAAVEAFPATPPVNGEDLAQYDCLVVLGS